MRTRSAPNALLLSLLLIATFVLPAPTGAQVARTTPELVEAFGGESALLRSTDGGRSFESIATGAGVAPRPFYYADIRVDPKDPDRIYNLHSSLQVSEDGGESFETLVSPAIIHGDVHDLRVDPGDPRTMIMANDGGVAVTHSRGESRRFVENLTLAQFYRISLDDALPYNIYGGLQDNGSWYGPSDVWENKGILNAHWTRVGGGDGFNVHDDPTSDRWGYSTSQAGNLVRFDKITGARTRIRPRSDSVELRFNWNAAVATDPLDPRALHIGSQFVHRSRDRGETWEIISPDLTTNDPSRQLWKESGGLTRDASGAETHTTIIDISPSPVQDGVIWVGTDDGNLQLTRDDGATWTNLTPAIPGVPPGTEPGLWISVDRGASWALWSHLPRVPVDDLEVHARDDDLVLGTHGRGARGVGRGRHHGDGDVAG